ncbi:MAG: tetratricopeptide repeat protein, partial [Gemmataceae bacterium]|nr:tetratricopeptide repeat protein [Gemmataceae bacterium]
ERWLAAGRAVGVADLLAAADPDPFRQAVRAAGRAGDAKQLAELAGQDPARDQPAWFAAVLGENPALPTDRRKALLERAVEARPSDLHLLMALDKLYPTDRRAGADERDRWCQAAAAAHPANLSAWYQLGLALRDRGDPAGAVRCYRKALALDPSHSLSHTGLGLALEDLDDVPGAVAEAREAVRLDPGRAWAHYNLGAVLRDTGGKMADAEAAIREAVRLDPKNSSFRLGLGMTRWFQDDPAGAAEQFREAVRLAPADPGPRDNLGAALQVLGDAAGAAEQFREGIRLDPKAPGGHNNLAWLLATGPDGHRDGRAAVEAATKACDLNGWKNPSFVATLAAAHAEAGDFGKAVEYQTRALADPKYDSPRGRARLGHYRAGKPYREPVKAVAPPPREAGR